MTTMTGSIPARPAASAHHTAGPGSLIHHNTASSPPPQQHGKEGAGEYEQLRQRSHASVEPLIVRSADQERAVLENLINHLRPRVVRDAVRSFPDKTLIGDDEHTLFVLNHCLTNLGRQSDKFRYKQHIFSLLSRRDLDSMGDMIHEKASYRLMDYLVEKRIAAMPGQRLVNILGRYERLGFMAQDIDDEDEDDEPQAPEPPSSVMGLKLACPTCNAFCADQNALNHHIHKQICKTLFDERIHKAVCPRCWQPFKQPRALQYHELNKVCSFGASPLTDSPFVTAEEVQHPAGVEPKNSKAHTGTAPASHPPSSSAPAQDPKPYDPNDPNGVLSVQERRLMNEEMEAARIKYGDRMRAAEAKATDGEEKVKLLSNLRNCFYTRQSLIRRKYGIRLRGARDKKFLEWERSNMDMSPLALSVAAPAFKKLRTSVGGDAIAMNGGEGADGGEGEEEERARKTPASTPSVEIMSNGLLPATNVVPTMIDPTIVAARYAHISPRPGPSQQVGSGSQYPAPSMPMSVTTSSAAPQPQRSPTSASISAGNSFGSSVDPNGPIVIDDSDVGSDTEGGIPGQ